MFVCRVLTIAFLQLYFVEEISGAMTVEMGVYSGVPDPRWVMEPTETILTLYSEAEAANLLYKTDAMPPILGYRGFIIEAKKGNVLILGSKTQDLQLQLFGSMPVGTIPNKVAARVLEAIKSGTIEPLEQERRKRYAPPFNALPFLGAAMKRNNCYNYANIRVTNTFAQPGRGSGAIYPAITKDRILNAAIRDGLVAVANGNTPAGSRHVVALVVEDCVDFHWYLKDSDGRWSHKPGKTPVSRLDNSGNPIRNPAACNMNGYEFVSYMTTDRNARNVRIN